MAEAINSRAALERAERQKKLLKKSQSRESSNIKLAIEQKQYNNEARHSSVWKIALADLMTVLMVFFLILWLIEKGEKEALQSANAVVQTEDGLPEVLKQRPQHIKEAVKERFPDAKVTKVNAYTMRIELDSRALFSSGTADVPIHKRLAVFKTAQMISELQQTFPFTTIEVQGHTDSIPLTDRRVYRDNWDLSSARANSIRQIFSSAGFADGQLRVVGYGSSAPIASNETEEGRFRNRRVVIDLITKPSQQKNPLTQPIDILK